MWASITMGIAFASLEYMFKIPAIKKIHNEMGFTTGNIQILWIVVTLIMAFAIQSVLPLPKTTVSR
jgi:hypothetical protein